MSGKPTHHVLASPFKEYVPAIGFVCMQWTFLEVMLGNLVSALLDVDSFGAFSDALTANIDFREKIQIALALGMLKKIDDRWFNELRVVLLDADNNLRCKRNRYAHDLYVFDTDAAKMKKVQFRTNIKHPQSHKPLELTTRDETTITPEEIWQAADDITNAAGQIALLAQQHCLVTRRQASPRKSS